MQRKKYIQWIAIAVSAIIVVTLFLIVILKKNKQSSETQSEPTTSPSVVPTVTTSDTPTAVPSATQTPRPTATTSPNTTHKAAAQAAYANKQYMVAITHYLQAIEATSETSELATLWHELGNAYRDNQNSSEALNAYTRAYSYNNKLGDAYLNKAALQWSLDSKDAAIATLEAGIAADASRKTDLQNTLDVYKALNK